MRYLSLIIASLAFFVNSVNASSYNGCGNNIATITVDIATGQVLDEERAAQSMYPASLVKLMTLYLAFEELDKGRLTMSAPLRISSHASKMPKMRLGLVPGKTIAVRDAILSIIVQSSNDSAVVLAENIAGSESAFVERMNKRAIDLKMTSTNFANASGLHNPNQYSTAQDMARIAMAIRYHYPQYFPLFSATDFTFRGVKYKTHNHVVTNYPWATGLKTGYTAASHFNIISSASKGGDNIVSVVMGCQTAKKRDNLVISLLNQGLMKMSKRGTNVASAAENPIDVAISTHQAQSDKVNRKDAMKDILAQDMDSDHKIKKSNKSGVDFVASKDADDWASLTGLIEKENPRQKHKKKSKHAKHKQKSKHKQYVLRQTSQSNRYQSINVATK